jgi:lipopolysaccharide biosynthesis glycosyltransferase
MMKRYNIDDILKITSIMQNIPVYLYLDVDVLFINNIRKLFKDSVNTTKTTIYLRPEVQFDFLNGMFYGELATDDDKELFLTKNVKLPGFSSGIFGWTNSEKIKDFFDFVKNKALTNDKEYYTVDQPFFNATLFNYFFKETGKLNFIPLDSEKIIDNRYVNNNEKIVLINYCGVPGDDSFHWDKMLLHLLIDSFCS